ncbi:MAG: TPM domain-containing protein [Melioribacteraceae bacterium]|nr:TPM domain-containing protein [Melioribacteraceae bacterium]MCF8354761.1 TPM domain-containing protein [Melioribacteraceae bacterium]MCF8394386.1 TPM domain-containing protein [Melioribacteraceae bacterium]MCF8417518.1 TPM domain-containing protein [Melioribacteraceae bacterium]
MKNDLVYHFFSDDDFLRVSKKIKEMEKITAGEIRVSIKETKPPLQKRKSIRELAEAEFYKLNMQNTRDKTGIIIYVLLKERAFYILADSGINEQVSQDTWDEVRNEMQSKFKDGHFSEGIILGIERVGNILSKYFPIKPDDVNELSNRVVLD